MKEARKVVIRAAVAIIVITIIAGALILYLGLS